MQVAGQRIAAQRVVGEIVVDAGVRPILFVDLQNACVLVVARGKNLWRLARQENRRVGALPIDHAADDNHAVKRGMARSVPAQAQLKLKLMLMRSSAARFVATSWRSQLSKRITLPASAG